MDRSTLDVADVFRQYGDTYRAEAGGSLSTAERRVMTAIEACRTAALGGHVEQCDQCGHQRVWYNSCRNRHCPTCRGGNCMTETRVWPGQGPSPRVRGKRAGRIPNVIRHRSIPARAGETHAGRMTSLRSQSLDLHASERT